MGCAVVITVVSVCQEEQWKHAQQAAQRNSKGLRVRVLLDASPECHFSHVWLTMCLGGPRIHTPRTCSQQRHIKFRFRGKPVHEHGKDTAPMLLTYLQTPVDDCQCLHTGLTLES